MKTTDKPILVEHLFDQSIERVWKAITQLDEMTQWFFDNIPDFEPVVGFKTEFTVQSEDRIFPHIWVITEVIPQKKIVYNWSYTGYNGDSIVTFELIEDGHQTKLRLTTKIVEDFPYEIPEFKWESCLAGWNYFIKDSLTKYLNT
jgi:uncharacterized protein YndB with AHSA1/START domain|nr:SRPBCC domain-containing protein [uncultured Psychroserpens sp.]